MKKLIQLFQQTFSSDPTEIVRLPIAGSNRQYYRLANKSISVVGVIGTSFEENKAFCVIALHLKSKGISVPKLYAYADDYSYYLQEDLGDEILFDKIVNSKNGVFDAPTFALLENVMTILPKIQYKGAGGLDYSNPERSSTSVIACEQVQKLPLERFSI